MNPGINSEKGFTLVELLIAVALIGLVLSLAFLLYAYGLGSFDTGAAQADIQQKARLVDTLFKKELRNAGALTLAPAGLEAEYDGFFYLESGLLYRNNTPFAEGITDIQVKINRESERSILVFTVTTGAGAQKFNLQDRFLLNNITAPFDGSYDDYRSLNDLVLYYDPEIPPAPPAEQFTLTVAVDGQGTTDPAPGNHAYDPDSLIALTAEPDSGWVFEKWIVDTQQYLDPLIPVFMDRDRTATAYFYEEGSGPSLAEIMAGINTLQFQNSPYDDKPVIIVPQAEGVVFQFIRSTTTGHNNIKITIAGNRKSATISRHSSQKGSGTITLKAEKDGETMEKEFHVDIPDKGAVTITAE
jgi:prepilin-type N-terminal cleavage/methylation domain-containing protein